MPKFKLDSIANLGRQMDFTPHAARLTQLVSAEEFLHQIDPAKAYPLEYVVFKITGYHPKKAVGDLLTGVALQHDIGLLIEQVSESLNLRSDAQTEPVLCIDDVAGRFNVTSKTIQRWRRRGLPARQFWFADGKRRVGFLLSSVERFLSAHREQVPPNANFTRMNDGEHDVIFAHARRLVQQGQWWENEVARRIGKRLGRSPLAILHMIRTHDQEHPQEAILLNVASAPTRHERLRIIHAYRHGATLKRLARKYHARPGRIYRVMMEARIERLGRRVVRFIDDPLYHQPQARAVIEIIARQEEIGQEVSAEQRRVPRDLPPYLQELYRTPLLSPARERGLFLKFNFHKFQFAQARRRMDLEFATHRQLHLLEGYLRKATEVKNAIIQANLRLVVSVARKHLRDGLNLMELISDGNLTLMRAVEGFDIHKGYRFSTYATLALMKGFARSVPLMRKGTCGAGASEFDLLNLPDPHSLSAADGLASREEISHLLTCLSERERRVLRAHYGLDKNNLPATFEQVGQRMGLTRQRVRQIELAALTKLRAMAKETI